MLPNDYTERRFWALNFLVFFNLFIYLLLLIMSVMSLSQWDASCSVILSNVVIVEFLNKTKGGDILYTAG